MNKKIIILIIGIFGLAGLLSWYFYVNTRTTTNTGSTGINLKNFSPFGSSSQDNTTGTNTNTGTVANNTDTNDNTNTPNKLHKITNFAVAGATYFEDTRALPKVEAPVTPTVTETPTLIPPTTTPTTTPTKNTTTTTKKTTTPVVDKTIIPTFEMVPSIRYVEKSTGHIFQKYLDNNQEGKISNSTIPSVYETVFGGEGKNLIYRYLASDGKTISSFLGTLGADKGEFLVDNIYDVSVSPDGSKYFYLSPFSNGVTGTVRAFSETKKNQIFSSPFTEWISQWANSQNIYLTTKASYSELGYVYSLNVANGTFVKLLGGIQGLTTLGSPDGKLLLYNASSNSGPKLFVFNITTQSVLSLNLSGLPEKCVWGQTSTTIYCGIPNYIGKAEPDSWYQGLTSFTDYFVKIDALSGNNNTIYPSIEQIDATHLFLDGKENNLFFINKKDSTLWSLDL